MCDREPIEGIDPPRDWKQVCMYCGGTTFSTYRSQYPICGFCQDTGSREMERLYDSWDLDKIQGWGG